MAVVQMLLKYTEYNEPRESRTNCDIVDAVTRKESKPRTTRQHARA